MAASATLNHMTMRKLLYISSLIITIGSLHGCSGCSDHSAEGDDIATSRLSLPVEMADTPSERARAIVHSIPVHIVGGRLYNIFNDLNDVHLAAAESIGIAPIHNLREAYNLRATIQRVYTCQDYTIDSLSHSMPFLVPRARQLLADIGRRFADTIRARGGHEYRIKVTSILRTDRTVASLRRRNRNASEVSAHCYGTTFDISYARFICLDSTFIVSLADLKNILGEILYDERVQGRCYVKFERKQGCFHITAR